MKGPEDQFLKTVVADLRDGKRRRATPRRLLGQFGFARRGSEVIKHVRATLRKHGLQTEPDFATADFDSQVSFMLRSPVPKASEAPQTANRESRFGRITVKPYQQGFEEASPQSGYRLLTDSYDIYLQLLTRLQSENRVRVYNHGQNSYRQDRDQFPFYIAIDRRHLGKQIGELEDAYLRALCHELGNAAVSTGQADEEVSPDETPTPTEPRIDFGDLERKIADRMEAGFSSLRDEFLTNIAEIESSIVSQVDRLQHDAVRKAAALHSETELTRLIEEEDARHRSELDTIRDQLDAAQEEISRYAAQASDLSDQLQAKDQEFQPDEAYATLGRTVRLFADLTQGSPIEILESAIKSASESSCTKRREVFAFLQLLQELSGCLKRGEDTGPLRDWFANRGYDYAAQDSETTTNKHGKERKFMVNGEPVLFQEHVTLFPNNQRDCSQVYFKRDMSQGKLIVAYIGKHLTITSW